MSTVSAADEASDDGVPPLLRRFVDDAALVAGGPTREMGEVVAAHLEARARWGSLIGSLVVPVSRLSQVVAVLVARRPAGPVPLTLAVDTGLGGVPKALSLLSARSALLATETVEMAAPADVDSLWLERVTEFVPDDVVAVVEPRRPDDGASPDWLDGLRRVVDHGCRPKLRCGGGRARAFPAVADVARFLAVVVETGRSFTASMGLQAAVRHVDERTGFPHHGWLNLLAASARLDRAADDLDGAREALEATDGAALTAEVAALDAPTASRVRALFSSCGSTAPVEHGAEMSRLGLVGS